LKDAQHHLRPGGLCESGKLFERSLSAEPMSAASHQADERGTLLFCYPC
jgi:hypothetical protein